MEPDPAACKGSDTLGDLNSSTAVGDETNAEMILDDSHPLDASHPLLIGTSGCEVEAYDFDFDVLDLMMDDGTPRSVDTDITSLIRTACYP